MIRREEMDVSVSVRLDIYGSQTNFAKIEIRRG